MMMVSKANPIRVLLFLLISVLTGLVFEHQISAAKHERALKQRLARLGDLLDQRGFDHINNILSSVSGTFNFIDNLKSPDQGKRTTNAVLSALRQATGADIVYVMDDEGTVLASTHYDGEKTLTGNNYRFRPYFTIPMEERTTALYAALGISTGKRGIFIARPITGNDESAPVQGVLVAKSGIDKLEEALKAEKDPAFLVSRDGIVFATNRPSFLFQSVFTISAKRRAELKGSRQFSDKPLSPSGLDFQQEVVFWDNERLCPYRTTTLAGQWQLIVLASTPPFSWNLFLAITGIIYLILLGGAALFHFYLALRDSEQRFRTLFSESADAYLLIQHGRFTDCNQAAAHMLGIDSRKAIGTPLFECAPPEQPDGEDSAESMANHLDEVILRGVNIFDWVFNNTKGNPFWCEVVMTRLDLEGETVIYTSLHNIDERKKTSLALEDARNLADAASQAKGDFLASMSHEIRTPMNGVLGMTNLLLENELSAAQRERAAIIHQSAQSLLGIVNQILDFSKIEAGKMELEHITFEMSELLLTFSRTMKHRADEKQLTLICPANPQKTAWYKGDPGRIHQILSNLVTNAIKFTREGTVSVFMDVVEQSPSGTLLRGRVVDTGMGMDEKTCNRLFTRFQQGSTEPTLRRNGTGLGLVITKQLVELMDGTIKVTSVPGQGTEFFFTLTLDNAEAREIPSTIPPDPSVPHPRMSGSVLVVEDNAVNQKVAIGMLASYGLETQLAANGKEALDLVSKHHFDLVLMDCQMPVMDGFEATTRIREGAAGDAVKQIPIVALTASALKQDQEQCRRVGMNDHLTKPVDRNQLHRILEEWLP